MLRKQFFENQQAKSSDYFKLLQNLLSPKFEQLDGCLSVLDRRVSALLNVFPQKFKTQIFERNQFSVWLLEARKLIDVYQRFVTLPMLKPADLKIFVNSVANNNFVVHGFLCLIDHCFLVGRIFDVRKGHSRNVGEIVSDLFFWTNVAIEQTVSFLFDYGEPSQKLGVSAFDELAINSNEFGYAFLLRNFLLAFFEKISPIAFPGHLFLNLCLAFDIFSCFRLQLNVDRCFALFSKLLLYFDYLLAFFALLFQLRFAILLVGKLHLSCFYSGPFDQQINAEVSRVFFIQSIEQLCFWLSIFPIVLLDFQGLLFADLSFELIIVLILSNVKFNLFSWRLLKNLLKSRILLQHQAYYRI